MPLTPRDKKLKKHFTDEYGIERGKRVYYATLNKRISQGRPINIPESKRMAKRRKHKRRHRGKRSR